jgi:lipopolysaccharide exporter
LVGNLLVFVLARRQSWPMLHMVGAMSVINTASKVVYYLVLLRIATTGCRTLLGPRTDAMTEPSIT